MTLESKGDWCDPELTQRAQTTHHTSHGAVSAPTGPVHPPATLRHAARSIRHATPRPKALQKGHPSVSPITQSKEQQQKAETTSCCQQHVRVV